MPKMNFNALDDDYITVWSRFMLGSEAHDVYDEIRKLAELGQVDAIQAYYLLKNANMVNQQIDNQVMSYNFAGNTADYNWDLALASSMTEEQEKFNQDIEKRLLLGKIIEKGIYRIDPTHRVSGTLYDFISNNDYVKLSYYSQDQMLKIYKQTNNPIFLQKALEVRKNIHLSTPLINVLRARLALAKLYKKDPNNPQIAFAYAKNLILWGSDKKKLAVEILTGLANRKYSNKLIRYRQNYDSYNNGNSIDEANSNTEIDDDNIEMKTIGFTSNDIQ